MDVDPHRYTEVTHESWFSRLGDAFKGIIVGLIMVAVALPLLFWNEGRAVNRRRALTEGAGVVVTVSPDAVDAASDGKLVHVSGPVHAEAVLEDPEFGVTADALKLQRVVEMYQWKEESQSREQKKAGGGTETVTTYEYTRVWDDDVVDSGRFKRPAGHENPTSMMYESREFVTEDATLGAFRLADSQIDKLDDYESYNVSDGAPPAGASAHRGGYYFGDPSSPSIGDLRVQFRIVPEGDATVVAAQQSGTFAPYATSGGGSIELVSAGVRTAEEMFSAAQAANTALTWALRLAGFLLLFVGFATIFKPLSVIADVVPLFGNIVGAGTSFIAFLLATSLWLVVVSIAWVFYRPLLGITLLVLAAAAGFFMWRRLRAAELPAPRETEEAPV